MKKSMKCLLCLLLALSNLLAVPAAVAEGPLRVDVFIYDFGDMFIGDVRAAMEKQFTTMKGMFNFTFFDAASDQQKQTEQIDAAIGAGSQMLLVNIVAPGSDEDAQRIVDMAKAKDIPVVFFNREISDDVVNSYEKCAYVGTDPNEGGYTQGTMIANYLLAAGNLEKTDQNHDKLIAYVMLRGQLGNPEAAGRTKYAVLKINELLASSGYKLFPSAANSVDPAQEQDGISQYYMYGNWSRELARDLMRDALKTFALHNGDIEIIIANNDAQALGAVDALNEVQYNLAGDSKGNIPTFGIDAVAEALEAVKLKKMAGTIRQDPFALATVVVFFARNVQTGVPMTTGIEKLKVDSQALKVRLPYMIIK